MRERGQASLEWLAVVLVVALLLGGGAVAAVRALPAADDDVELARRHAAAIVLERGTVGVPVDPRTCRGVACSVGAEPVLFTHVVRRGPVTYVQYWAYWPDSSWHGVAGRHADDWESFQVRIDADGTAWARASAHHGYTGHRVGPDLNVNQVRPDWVPARWRRGWVRWRGGYRVARHSHAGYVDDGRQRRSPRRARARSTRPRCPRTTR